MSRQEPIRIGLSRLRRFNSGDRDLRRRQFTTFPAITIHKYLSTRRTRGMRFKPRVNTSDVESVTAPRQRSEDISGDELRQANRAIEVFSGDVAGVGDFGDFFEDFVVEAFVWMEMRWSGWVPGDSAGEAANPGATSDGDEAEETYDGAEESGEDDDEVGGGGAFGGGVWWVGCGEEPSGMIIQQIHEDEVKESL